LNDYDDILASFITAAICSRANVSETKTPHLVPS